MRRYDTDVVAVEQNLIQLGRLRSLWCDFATGRVSRGLGAEGDALLGDILEHHVVEGQAWIVRTAQQIKWGYKILT